MATFEGILEILSYILFQHLVTLDNTYVNAIFKIAARFVSSKVQKRNNYFAYLVFWDQCYNTFCFNDSWSWKEPIVHLEGKYRVTIYLEGTPRGPTHIEVK